MDTRTNILLLLDYKEYYGENKSIEDAKKFLKGISSRTLLNYISSFNINLYLYDNSEHLGKIQFDLVNSLLGKCNETARNKWVKEINKQSKKGHAPIMFWTYSNLLFYDLIFDTFNELPSKDLNSEEALRFFNAYLIVNGVANNKIRIEEEEFFIADELESIEDVTIPNFIYQRDYKSSTDFSNQVTRGVEFFRYLESSQKYGKLVQDYYKTKNVQGHLRMFRNLFVLFSELKIKKGLTKRNHVAYLYEFNIHHEVDMEFINTLSINDEVKHYKKDQSFGVIRKKVLFKLSEYKFLILDVNFLLDQFYKAQVFSFNAFLKGQKIEKNFLSDKGKEFMDEIYFPKVINKCFSNQTTFFGGECINSNNDELCDCFLRIGENVCLMEFKDVLLNAKTKNSGDKEKLFDEFDKKFLENQKRRPKGIKQLLNAIKDIDENSISFNANESNDQLIIYPVIVYTDTTFGLEGINRVYAIKFKEELEKLSIQNLVVKEVVFISLSFFELHEDYFANNYLDYFEMLDGYMRHINHESYALTTFEVYSRFYMNNNKKVDLGITSWYRECQQEIFNA